MYKKRILAAVLLILILPDIADFPVLGRSKPRSREVKP